MYAGRVVERAAGAAIFDDPQHPYTLGLLGSIPKIEENRDRLLAIEGTVPAPFDLPQGCRFHPRCVFAAAACTDGRPAAARCSAETTAPPASARRSRRWSRDRAAAGSRGPGQALQRPPRPDTGQDRRQVRAVDGISFTLDPRRDAGAGRRVGLRQVHHGAAGAAADRSDRGDDPFRGPGHHGDARRSAAQAAAADADRVPGPVRLAEPAHDGRRDRSKSR